MELHLYTIDNAPASLPIWQLILDDLGCPPVPRIARTLGVSQRSVYRWNRQGSAPRMACLALFWLTRWGVSRVDAQAVNDARTACGMLACLQQENAQLRQAVAHLQTLGQYGSANSPLLRGTP